MNLSMHQSAETTKLLLLGDSGSGKTGALASLANAGFNLRIIDLDNGLDVLRNLLGDAKSPYAKDAISRVEFVTITDPMKNVASRLQPTKATAWQRAVGLLGDWKDSGAELGSITTWGPQDVLVIDSLTMLSNAALNFVLAMNGRLGQHPQLQDWGAGQTLIESLIQMLYDESIRCNVIVTCHIKFIGEEGLQRGYPNTLGQALPPKMGRYFNTILMARSMGQGSKVARKILTNPTGLVELKNTAPLRVAAEYDLATGLADYFAAVRGQDGAK
jgi:AAA domain